MKKILLLDIENVHKNGEEISQYLQQYSKIYIAYANPQIKFNLDELDALAPFVVEKRLKLLKMPKSGPNSADFGLSFLAGQLSVKEQKKKAIFDVMSNDRSMEYIVDLLTLNGFQARVVKQKKVEVAMTEPALSAVNEPVQNLQPFTLKYCENLLKANFSRPAKVDSLLNSIKASLKLEDQEASIVIESMRRSKIIQIENKKVIYENNLIEKYLKISA